MLPLFLLGATIGVFVASNVPNGALWVIGAVFIMHTVAFPFFLTTMSNSTRSGTMSFVNGAAIGASSAELVRHLSNDPVVFMRLFYGSGVLTIIATGLAVFPSMYGLFAGLLAAGTWIYVSKGLQ